MGYANQLKSLEQRLEPHYARLAAHPLYGAFETIEDLHVFMESHVFAVWDFMSLLKSLQLGLTCVEVPWLPSSYAESRRLVNEIVLGEESDRYRGVAVSHFELYRMAMCECMASTDAIDSLIHAVSGGLDWQTALALSGATPAAQSFVHSTFRTIATAKLHAIAAAFTFGREDLIPEMFRGFIRDQDAKLHGQLATFRWYLDRHIEVDGEEHGPMALRMIAELCGDDEVRWQEASDAAVDAVKARIALWDGILQRIAESQMVATVSR